MWICLCVCSRVGDGDGVGGGGDGGGDGAGVNEGVGDGICVRVDAFLNVSEHVCSRTVLLLRWKGEQ